MNLASLSNRLTPKPVEGPVRGKLLRVVVLTTGIALVVAGAAMLIYDMVVYRQTWISDLATEGAILALSTAPALAFDDHEAAVRNLSALEARPAILVAALYSTDGMLYAQYMRSGEAAPGLLPQATKGVQLLGGNVELTHRIVYKGEWLGTIYLRAHYDVVGRLTAYLGIFTLATLASMSVALVLLTRLRKDITRPLDAMTDVAQRVVEKRDYALRVKETTDGEIGLVVSAFNSMLDEVQAHARALEDVNSALRTNEKLYRAIGESIDYGVWICDSDGHNIYASESFLQLTGLTQQQCSSLGWQDLLHPDDVEATASAWGECVQSGLMWYREHRFRGRDGLYHPILAQGVPIRGDDGRIAGWAGINLDISRLKLTEDALLEANRRKDEFLATLAHELRNPLAPIMHSVKLLGAAGIDASQQEWVRDIIARQVQRMALLLDDLLDISRVTRGRLELKKSRVELASLVASAIEVARPLIESKRHTLSTQLPPQAITLDVDPLRLSQALSNLLLNAAKYSGDGGQISIAVTLDEAALKFAVSDNGIGLSPPDVAKVFEMFTQIESAAEHSAGGLGIGLALVRGLVTLHGGRVEASSAGIGRGCTFTIQLPRSVVIGDGLPVEPSQPALIRQTPLRCKVLVVDDNHDAADALVLALQVAGFSTCVAYSGLEGLEICARERPEAAILDVGMPDLTGHQVAERMRQQDWGRQMLLLALTGWGQEEDKKRAKAAGFDHHLTKPVEFELVERLLNSFLSSRQTIA